MLTSATAGVAANECRTPSKLVIVRSAVLLQPIGVDEPRSNVGGECDNRLTECSVVGHSSNGSASASFESSLLQHRIGLMRLITMESLEDVPGVQSQTTSVPGMLPRDALNAAG